MDVESIYTKAIREVEEEDFRKKVEELKRKIRSKRSVPWWRRLFPYRIIKVKY